MQLSCYARLFGKTKLNPSKIYGGTPCLEWVGYTNPKGYGRIAYLGVSTPTHRMAWELRYGPPGQLQVLHHCDNPPCVNTDHLFVGSLQDNMDDKVSKGRQQRLKGESHGGAKLTNSQVLEIRQLFLEGQTNKSQLGRQFGVHHSVIRNIVLRKLWTHI